MKQDLDLGSAPSEEDCAQVGSEGYYWRAWHECRALVQQLRRLFGPEPPGCRLHVKDNPHDFGTYLSVSASFDPDNKEAAEYAYRCEAESPKTWDDEARAYFHCDGKPPRRRKPTAKRKETK